MTARAAWWVLAGCIAAVSAPRAAHGEDAANETVAHRVRQGDTLELIAAEFYGDRNKAVFIMVENKMTHARPLRPGERLRVPVSREIAVAPGDTFESLAAAYLGSARRGTFLAELNGLSPDDGVPAGAVLTIPFTILHTAGATESVNEIAKAYFGDGKNADLLRRYNFLTKTSIEKGDPLIVPVYHVRVNPSKALPLDAPSKARRERRRDAMARAAKALPAARQAWKASEFAEVKAALSPLEADLDFLDAGDAADIGILLGSAHVAYDEPELALALFKRVVERQSRRALQRYRSSPKLLEVWQQAGGPVE